MHCEADMQIVTFALIQKTDRWQQKKATREENAIVNIPIPKSGRDRSSGKRGRQVRFSHGVHHHRIHHREKMRPHPNWRPFGLKGIWSCFTAQ